MTEHEAPAPDPAGAIEPFIVRKFDKPDFMIDPCLGMVRLDPKLVDAQAKIRQTLVNSYEALINQIEMGIDQN